MNILELAQQHANSAADPEVAERIKAKRAKQEAKAVEIKHALAPVAGQLVLFDKQRAKLQVSATHTTARIEIVKQERFEAKATIAGEQLYEIRYRDGKEVLDGWECGHDGQFWCKCPESKPLYECAQLEDLVKHIAEQVGPMLYEPPEGK